MPFDDPDSTLLALCAAELSPEARRFAEAAARLRGVEAEVMAERALVSLADAWGEEAGTAG